MKAVWHAAFLDNPEIYGVVIYWTPNAMILSWMMVPR